MEVPESITLTVLNDEWNKEVVSVRISEELAPLDEGGERDWSNADWPSDEEVSSYASARLGRPVLLKFFDRGDDLAEGIYHAASEEA